MSDIHSSIQEAYNRHAKRYDDLQSSDGGMRQHLWKEYRSLFCPGEHVLDLGCGTGIDSIYLAQQLDCCVTAVDISSNMLKKLEEKRASYQLRDQITIVRSSIEQLTRESISTLNGVVSAFAAINTISSFSRLHRFLSAHLKQGAPVLLHGLNRNRLLKLLRLRWNWSTGRSYDKKGQRRLVDIENVEVPHRLLDPVSLYRRYFEDDFVLSRVYGIGWLAQPSISFDSSSALMKSLRYIDRSLGSFDIFRKASRYFVLIMRKR